MLLLRPCYGHISLIPAAFCFIIISEQLCFLISFPSCVFVSFPSFFLVLYWRWKAECLFNLQYQNKIPINANKGEVSSRFFFTFFAKDKTTVIFRKVFLLDFGDFFCIWTSQHKSHSYAIFKEIFHSSSEHCWNVFKGENEGKSTINRQLEKFSDYFQFLTYLGTPLK